MYFFIPTGNIDCHFTFELQSEVGHSRNSSNRATVKAPISGNSQMPLVPKVTASSNRRLGRSRSHKDLSLIHDGYSVRSAYLVYSMFVHCSSYIHLSWWHSECFLGNLKTDVYYILNNIFDLLISLLDVQ